MEHERLARLVLARLWARAFGRDVSTAEIERSLVEEGVPPAEVPRLLAALETSRVALCTRTGWRPVSPPVQSRVREACASFAWLHA